MLACICYNGVCTDGKALVSKQSFNNTAKLVCILLCAELYCMLKIALYDRCIDCIFKVGFVYYGNHSGLYVTKLLYQRQIILIKWA